MAKKILVIDDDDVVIEMLQAGLEQKGYQVRCVRSGREGLERVRLDRPDLIILDIIMPGMDGTEVARLLRESDKTRNIPIVFLTVLWEKNETAMNPHDFGVNVVIGKPFKLDEMLEKIERLLNTQQKSSS